MGLGEACLFHRRLARFAVDESKALGDVGRRTEVLPYSRVDDLVQRLEVTCLNADFLRIEYNIRPECCDVYLVGVSVDECIRDS